MRDAKDRIIADAVEALRETANGLRTQGFDKWADTTDKIATHLETQNAKLAALGDELAATHLASSPFGRG